MKPIKKTEQIKEIKKHSLIYNPFNKTALNRKVPVKREEKERELLFDFMGPNPTSLFTAAELKVLQLVTQCVAGAFMFYFSLTRIWSELTTYTKTFSK